MPTPWGGVRRLVQRVQRSPTVGLTQASARQGCWLPGPVQRTSSV
jgi:hypothetical protein